MHSGLSKGLWTLLIKERRTTDISAEVLRYYMEVEFGSSPDVGSGTVMRDRDESRLRW